jgi:glycosyltransferase involved in cell wall biosynthesis
MESKIIKVGVLSIADRSSGGVYQYTLSLLEALKYLEDNFELFQIRNERFPKILKQDLVIRNRYIILKLKRIIHALTGVKLGSLVPKSIPNFDIIISPVIRLLPYHFKKPYIVTIHDFQHEYYPEFFTLKERIIRKIIYRTGKYANLVVCESQFVKKDIIKFLGVDEEKIRVIPSPPPSYLINIKIDEKKMIEIKKLYNLPDKYLFYPANFWFHKNHIKLLEALFLIKRRYGEEIPLILVGSKQNNFDNVMKKIRELGMESQVKYLGYVPDDDMPYLYKLSTALVMPTLFESVSLPIWEAFYLGCPVVSSNVCALPEQVRNAGLLFDPQNIQDIAKKVYRIWTDEDLRKELVKKGYERVKNLTLENYAKHWEKIIKEALEKAKS